MTAFVDKAYSTASCRALGHDVLAVIVVDLHFVEFLQVAEIVEDEVHDVASDSRTKSGAVGKLDFPV